MGVLNGKVALISGTAGGQGRAAALKFAAEGALIFGADVKTKEAEETVEMVRAAGGQMHSMSPLDLSDPDQAKAWVEEAVRIYAGIDIVYNNAGSLRAR